MKYTLILAAALVVGLTAATPSLATDRTHASRQVTHSFHLYFGTSPQLRHRPYGVQRYAHSGRGAIRHEYRQVRPRVRPQVRHGPPTWAYPAWRRAYWPPSGWWGRNNWQAPRYWQAPRRHKPRHGGRR